MYKIEVIPHSAELYRRVHPRNFNTRKRKIGLGAFIVRQGEKALSVNWNEHSTAEKTAIDPITKRKFYVGGLIAEIPRKEQLEVKHAPTTKNRSHSLILGAKLIAKETKYDIALIFSENCRPIITKIK